jgi:hypothetical protein
MCFMILITEPNTTKVCSICEGCTYDIILGGIKIIFIHVVTTLCRYIKIKCFLLFVRVGRCILNLIKHSYHIRLQCRPSNLMIVSNARFSSKLCSLMAHIKVFLILLSPQKNESKRKFVYN